MLQIEIIGGKIIYGGINLDITPDQVNDYCIQTGQIADTLIQYLYKNHPEYKAIVREKKLKSILN